MFSSLARSTAQSKSTTDRRLAWRADCSNSFLRESFHFYLNGLNCLVVNHRLEMYFRDELNVMYDVVSLNCTNTRCDACSQVI